MRRGRSRILLILVTFFVFIFLIPIPWYRVCQPCPPNIACIYCRDGWYIRKPIFWSFIVPFTNDVKRSVIKFQKQQKFNYDTKIENWETYIDKQRGFSIQYPRTWKVDVGKANVRFLSWDRDFGGQGAYETILSVYSYEHRFKSEITTLDEMKNRVDFQNSEEIILDGVRALKGIDGYDLQVYVIKGNKEYHITLKNYRENIEYSNKILGLAVSSFKFLD